jgi:WD40 repeat protein
MLALSGGGRIALVAERERDLFAGRGARICVWDLTVGVCLHVLADDGDSIRQVALSRNGSLASSVSERGFFRVWEIASGACLQARQGHVNCVALTEDGKTLLSGDADGSLGIWDASSGELIRLRLNPFIIDHGRDHAPDAGPGLQ